MGLGRGLLTSILQVAFNQRPVYNYAVEPHMQKVLEVRAEVNSHSQEKHYFYMLLPINDKTVVQPSSMQIPEDKQIVTGLTASYSQ